MEHKTLFKISLPALAMIGCHAGDAREASELGEASAYIGTTTVIPASGTCTHVVATRLSDFAVSEYQGPLAGGAFSVLPGENRVTATAFPLPCGSEPAQPPWVADVQVAAFTTGANTLMLHFHEPTSVAIDPTFDDNSPTQVVLRPGSPFPLGRNGEDAAGPNFSLDGWDIKRIALPPAAPSETLVFSTRGKGGLTGTPRGLAAMPDGSFVVQLTATSEPLRQFTATGDFVESWPVVYPGSAVHFDITDGLEAIDATHLVRTGQLNAPIGCDDTGAGCVQSGLDILELVAVPGGHEVHVTRQLLLPELTSEALNLDFPVAVTPLGTGFAVVSIPNSGAAQLLTLLDAGGAVIAGPVSVAGDLEGVFVAGDGRLGALDYHGHLTMRDPATLAERPGETAFYADGIDVSLGVSLAWDSARGKFLTATQENRLIAFSPDLTGAADVGIDTSAYLALSGVDYRADTDQVAIADRIPPIDSISHTRIPTVDFYDMTTHARVSTVTLRGVPLPLRTASIAYVSGHAQIAAIYRRAGGAPDATLDTVVYLHNLDGSLAGSFALAPLGFARAQSVGYLPASDELVVTAADAGGVERLVVTSPTGQPRRSYRLDAIGDAIDVAPITSGPSAGDLGAIENQPSKFFQISLQ